MGADIFHLATPEAWEAAQATGKISPSSLADQGFVHCSTREQLAGTIERHFADADELVLLRLDESSIRDALRWEESHPGEHYPHVHRAIATDEIVEIIPWHRPPREP